MGEGSTPSFSLSLSVGVCISVRRGEAVCAKGLQVLQARSSSCVRAAARGHTQRMGLRAMFGLGGGEKKEFPVKKSEDEWRQTLGSAEYRVLRKVRVRVCVCEA